jgi:hypothetical protein
VTNKALDHFTGAADQDIEGRAADGAGGPGPTDICTDLQAGEWNRVEYSPDTGTIDLIDGVVLKGAGTFTSANNLASITVDMAAAAVGDLLVLVVYSRNGTARSPNVPSGWTIGKRGAGGSANGELLVAYRVADGTEGADLAVSFTGAGSANTNEQAQIFSFKVATGAVLGVTGSTSTWTSASTLGPVTGITPGTTPSLVLLLAAKQNDLRNGGSGTAPIFQVPSTAGWSPVSVWETTFGSQASWTIFSKWQTTGAAISTTSITDDGAGTAQAGAGVGFMLEFLLASPPAIHECRHRSGTGEWNHYVLQDADLQPLVMGDDYMVEAEFVFWDYDEAIWASVLVLHDDTYEIGYELNWLANGEDASTLILYRLDPQSPAEQEASYVTIDEVFGLDGVPLGSPVKLRLCVSGSLGARNFDCYLNDVLIFSATDLNTSHVDTWPEGINPVWPGICMSDTGGTGAAMQCNYMRVALACDDEYPNCGTPCEGGDDNPYPHDPPPDNPILIAPVYPRANAVWNPVQGPGANITAPGTRPFLAGVAVDPADLQALYVRDRGAWVLIPSDSLEQFPPPDTPLPPYYDPCELLDPDVDLPPVGDVSPVPATGTRYYGLAGMATTLLGAAFNGTQRALGSWTPTDLAQAAARSGVLLGGIGSYSQFRTNNVYDPNRMDTFIETIAATIGASLLSYQTSGNFGAVIIADDFKVVKLWPPSGLSNTELARIAAKWAAELPGIRLGLRIRPRAIGTPISGIAVYVAQYDGPQQIPGRGIDNPPTVAELRAWRDAELDELESWGGSAVINIQPNYLKGGADSGSAYISTGTFTDGKPSMSPAEVIDCADAWFGDSGDGRSDLMWGSTGYLYHPDYMPITGMADAMATFRNGLMGLSPI